MSPCVCSLCSDSGLLQARARCPLCEGFGASDAELWEHAQTPPERGRLLLRRILRTGLLEISAQDAVDLGHIALSKQARRRIQDGGASSPEDIRREP